MVPSASSSLFSSAPLLRHPKRSLLRPPPRPPAPLSWAAPSAARRRRRGWGLGRGLLRWMMAAELSVVRHRRCCGEGVGMRATRRARGGYRFPGAWSSRSCRWCRGAGSAGFGCGGRGFGAAGLVLGQWFGRRGLRGWVRRLRVRFGVRRWGVRRRGLRWGVEAVGVGKGGGWFGGCGL